MLNLRALTKARLGCTGCGEHLPLTVNEFETFLGRGNIKAGSWIRFRVGILYTNHKANLLLVK